MRSLIILVASTTVISGLRDAPPGFSVDYRSFGSSPVYQEQRLPDRDQTRSFRESSQQPPTQQPQQAFREESFREYRAPFLGREETRIFHEESRGGFQGDTRVFKEENRESFKGELRNFNDESRPFRDETRVFKDDIRSFRDDTRPFRDERPFLPESRPFRDGPRHFRDERPFRDERKQFREEIRPHRDEYRSFRDEARPLRDDFRNVEGPGNFRDDVRTFKSEPSHFRDDRPYSEQSGPLKNGGRPFKEESGPFRTEIRPFKEESGPFRTELRPFKEESGPFKNELRPFREESGPFRNEARPFREEIASFRDDRTFRDESVSLKNGARPFKDESGPLRDEPRPFRDDSQSFKDEILFTQESQSLAEAKHRYSKEQEHRQPLSFGGHSSYLKYGNHGLGFASVPAAVLPLEVGTTQQVSDMSMSELSQTAATQSPGTSSPHEISQNQISVTLAPEIGSTPSQSPSGNTIDSGAVNGERKNEKLAGEASTSQASAAVTISTSGGTNVTPKVVFGSGSGSTSNPPMRITSADSSSGTGVQQANAASALHAAKSSMHTNAGSSTSSYFPSEATQEIPAALLNYIFKYQMPQDAKVRYVYRQSLPSESLNHIQTVPLVHHHQTAKYGILPEFKIPTLSAIHRPEGTINYVSTAGLPKVSYLNANSPGLSLGSSYSSDSVPAVNFARNVIQLDQGGQFSHFGQTAQLPQLQQIGQTDQFPQFRQLATSASSSPLGQYGQFGQNEQTRSNPFNQGGLQLQLGGFGGIDYSALSGNSETSSRLSPSASLGIAKVGLSFPEPTRPPLPTFTKMFGESLW